MKAKLNFIEFLYLTFQCNSVALHCKYGITLENTDEEATVCAKSEVCALRTRTSCVNSVNISSAVETTLFIS